MKRLASIAALAAVIVAAAVPALADDNMNTGNISIRIGGFYPLQNETRNSETPPWVAGGIDYKLNGITGSMVNSGYISLSLDYASRGDYRNAPLMLNYTTNGKVYGSIGAGASFTRFPADDGSVNDRVRFAYSAAIGYNFNSTGQLPMFFEVRYLGNDQPRVAGVAFYIGARF